LNFIIALQNMKQAIEAVLAAAMQPAPAEPSYRFSALYWRSCHPQSMDGAGIIPV
jgi:hypothetical protein